MGYGTRDKGRNDPRNGDETNDNLSLKTLRAKSYGFRLVFSRLYSREFFARFASRDRDTRAIQTPPYLLSTRWPGTMKNTSRRKRMAWTKVHEKLLMGRGLVAGFGQVL